MGSKQESADRSVAAEHAAAQALVQRQSGPSTSRQGKYGPAIEALHVSVMVRGVSVQTASGRELLASV